jgi:Fic family protein
MYAPDEAVARKLDLTGANSGLIGAYGPLEPVTARQRDEWHRIELAYTSNSLAGNSLAMTDTLLVLQYGLSVGGGLFHEVSETVGHGEAYGYAVEAVRGGRTAPFADVARHAHFLLCHRTDPKGAGVFRAGPPFPLVPGHVPPEPRRIAPLMSALSDRYGAMRDTAGPLVLAAFAHQGLSSVSPPAAGNGRVARLMMNMALLEGGLLPVSIPPVRRDEYLEAVRASPGSPEVSGTPFFGLLLGEEIRSQELYMRMMYIVEEPEAFPVREPRP